MSRCQAAAYACHEEWTYHGVVERNLSGDEVDYAGLVMYNGSREELDWTGRR